MVVQSNVICVWENLWKREECLAGKGSGEKILFCCHEMLVHLSTSFLAPKGTNAKLCLAVKLPE